MIKTSYSPTYGTLHAAPHTRLNASSQELGSISYTFVGKFQLWASCIRLWHHSCTSFAGTDFRAQFAPGPSSTSDISCSVDGVKQPIYSAADGLFCVNNATLPETNHTLLIGVQSSDILFDYIWYMTTKPNQQDGFDVIFLDSDQAMPANAHFSYPGEEVFFGFDGELSPVVCMVKLMDIFQTHLCFAGRSVGIYATIPPDLAVSNLTWTYQADSNGTTMVFNTTYSTNANLGTQLLLQTTSFEPGHHYFSLTFKGPRFSNTSSISINQIIAQNSTSSINITAFPPATPFIDMTDPSSSGYLPELFQGLDISFNPDILGGILGSFLGASLIAGLIILFILRRRRYQRKGMGDLPASTIQPFWHENIFHYGYTTSNRPKKGSTPSDSSPGSRNPTPDPSPHSPASTSVLYMVHRDGGEMAPNAVEPEGRLIVELPPDYNAIAGPSSSVEEQYAVDSPLTLSNLDNPEKGSNVYRLK